MLQDRDLQSVQNVRSLVREAKAAQAVFKKFTQSQVDKVFAEMADAGFQAAEPLAKLAVEETGYGKVADKILKNQFGSRDVYEAYADMRTVGVINEVRDKKIMEIAEPVGVVAAIIPTTNPTSTALFKTLIAIKSRNGIVVSPHPRAARCTCEAVRVMRTAAERAGAPKGLIGCITISDMAGTQELMRAKEVGVILATGGPGLVRAAYSAGKPAYGVGPGNVPVYLDRSANVEKAVSDVIAGKTFDWGTLCSSEQALVVDSPVYDQVVSLLRAGNAHFMTDSEARRVGSALVSERGHINPELVGHSPQSIAEAAGFSVSQDVKLLVAELRHVGPEEPLSREKLSPVLSLYRVDGWEDGCEHCIQLLNMGGRGHTLGVHAQDENVILQFGLQKPAFRIVVNTPTSIGAVGYTTSLDPSMTLGCGSLGGNITADNISPKHLMNIKRVAWETRSVVSRQADSATWKPRKKGGKSTVSSDHAYHKALSSNVSRKGAALLKREGAKAAAAPESPQHGKTVYGKDALTGEEVDAIAAAFTRQRHRS